MCPEEKSNEATTGAQERPADAVTPDLQGADLEALRRQLEEEKQRAESHYASWQRSAADFANYKRRTEQERAEAASFANAMLILNILPTLDDLERALNSVSTELAGLTWIDGIHIIYRKLQGVLESQGLKAIEAVGQPFDPNLHEAVLRAPGEEGKVLAELQRGYMLENRVIRPTLVKVGTGEAAAPAAPEGLEPQAQAGEGAEESATS